MEFSLLCLMKAGLLKILSTIRQRPLLCLSLIFIVSRIIFYAAGVRFKPEFIENAPHCIDFTLLKSRFWESLFYMHGQPPVFNFYIGLVIKHFEIYALQIFQGIYFLIGLLHTILLYKLMRQLRIGKIIAFVFTLCFTLSSAAILYENWLFYTYLEVFILTACANFLVLFFNKQEGKYLFFFFCGLSLLVLTRSMFHLAWFTAIGIFMLLLLRRQRKQIIKTIWFPILIILLWYGKNYVLYEKFTASTWLGMNVSRLVLPQQGIARHKIFDTIMVYEDYVQPSGKYPHIALLQIPVSVTYTKSKKFPNYYHIDYITASDSFLHQSLQAVKDDPKAYLKRVLLAHILYFQPVTEQYWLGTANRESIGLWAIICDFRLPSIVFKHLTGSQLYHPSLSSFLIYLSLIIFYVVLIYSNKSKKLITEKELYVLIFMLFNILYVSVVSNWLEYGENNRFRFTLNAYVLVLCAYAFQYVSGKSSRFNLKAGA